MILKYLLTGFLVVCGAVSFAQKTLVFREQLTFEYQKEGKKAEFSVYLDRKSSTWLFTNADSFDGKADGIDWVVAYPNGKYLTCGIDDVNHKNCQQFESLLAQKITPKISGKATNQSHIFGQNKYGWPTLAGRLYQLSAGRATQTVFLTTVPFDCRPLYAYNSLLDIEHYLPGFQQIDYPSYLPKNQLVLSDAAVKLLSLSPTDYEIDLSQYKLLK